MSARSMMAMRVMRSPLPRILFAGARLALTRGWCERKSPCRRRARIPEVAFAHEKALVVPASSAARYDRRHDEPGDREIVALCSLAQTARDAFAVSHLSVLAHLPLALQPCDDDAEAHDAAQH